MLYSIDCRTPQLNLQFTARTGNGTVRDYFSARIDPRGGWQQISVIYDGRHGSVRFYADGFPVKADNVPQVSCLAFPSSMECECVDPSTQRACMFFGFFALQTSASEDHRLSSIPAALTIGR